MNQLYFGDLNVLSLSIGKIRDNTLFNTAAEMSPLIVNLRSGFEEFVIEPLLEINGKKGQVPWRRPSAILTNEIIPPDNLRVVTITNITEATVFSCTKYLLCNHLWKDYANYYPT